jgi:2-dehydropantoate 2-reductase
MKVLIIGIGAIGGWLAEILHKGGASVDLLARGASYEALQNGMTIHEDGGVSRLHHLPVYLAPPSGKLYDVIVLATKTHDNAAMFALINTHSHDNTLILTAQNGMPVWMMAENGLGDMPYIKGKMVAGVIHGSTTLEKPGVIRIHHINRMIMGQAQGTSLELQTLSDIFKNGGLNAPIAHDIRVEIWSKLWGNMSMNPVSALTRLSKNPLFETSETLDILKAMMDEHVTLGLALGLTMTMTTQDRLDIASKLGDFKTSTHKDAIALRPMEIEGLLGDLLRLAAIKNVAMPVSKIVYGLSKGLNLSFL